MAPAASKHLEVYTNDDLKMICEALDLPVTAPNKAAYIDRLSGKFTPAMAKIFESYGGFDIKPGDATVSTNLPESTLRNLPSHFPRSQNDPMLPPTGSRAQASLRSARPEEDWQGGRADAAPRDCKGRAAGHNSTTT